MLARLQVEVVCTPVARALSKFMVAFSDEGSNMRFVEVNVPLKKCTFPTVAGHTPGTTAAKLPHLDVSWQNWLMQWKRRGRTPVDYLNIKLLPCA